MKHFIPSALIAIFFAFTSCSADVSPDAVEMKVDFTWEGFVACAYGANPEIRLSGIPDDTKFLLVSMTEQVFDYGKQKLTYDGSGIIKMGALDEIRSPCDTIAAVAENRFKYTVKAVNEDGIIIGSGSKERDYPDKK
jgi:hypothetical protein